MAGSSLCRLVNSMGSSKSLSEVPSSSWQLGRLLSCTFRSMMATRFDCTSISVDKEHE